MTKLMDSPATTAGDRLAGVWCPALTPLDADLNPDPGRLVDHVAWLLSSGCNGVGLFGTTGEATSFSVDERMAMLDAVLTAGIDSDRLAVGTGCCALTDSVRLTRHAVESGCRHVLMLPPFYYKGVGDEALFRSYAEIIERVGAAELDIILYHFPKLSGVPITHGLIERLIAAYPAQIGGVKDSTGDADSTAGFLAAFPDLAIFPGTEAFLLDALRGGAAGTITATANVHAGAARRVYDAWCAGSEDADALQVPVTAVRQAIQVQPMVPMLKYLVAKARSDDAWLRVRPPIATLPVADCAAVEHTLDDLGFVMGG
jgi:4-hydroxy-tetrahydrodipicolinate synthase